jgi:hypothetical protein
LYVPRERKAVYSTFNHKLVFWPQFPQKSFFSEIAKKKRKEPKENKEIDSKIVI